MTAPPSRVAVAVEILRHRVDDDVRAKFNGALEIGAEKSVVDDELDVALVDELRHLRDVGDAHRGIGRRLDVQHLRVGSKGEKTASGLDVSTKLNSRPK